MTSPINNTQAPELDASIQSDQQVKKITGNNHYRQFSFDPNMSAYTGNFSKDLLKKHFHDRNNSDALSRNNSEFDVGTIISEEEQIPVNDSLPVTQIPKEIVVSKKTQKVVDKILSNIDQLPQALEENKSKDAHKIVKDLTRLIDEFTDNTFLSHASLVKLTMKRLFGNDIVNLKSKEIKKIIQSDTIIENLFAKKNEDGTEDIKYLKEAVKKIMSNLEPYATTLQIIGKRIEGSFKIVKNDSAKNLIDCYKKIFVNLKHIFSKYNLFSTLNSYELAFEILGDKLEKKDHKNYKRWLVAYIGDQDNTKGIFNPKNQHRNLKTKLTKKSAITPVQFILHRFDFVKERMDTGSYVTVLLKEWLEVKRIAKNNNINI